MKSDFKDLLRNFCDNVTTNDPKVIIVPSEQLVYHLSGAMIRIVRCKNVDIIKGTYISSMTGNYGLFKIPYDVNCITFKDKVAYIPKYNLGLINLNLLNSLP